jgi:choline-phosphate cytidylyltransferase
LTKVITYGTFDMLHSGHINLLKRAKELGDYLIVGVTGEDYDKQRGKLNVAESLHKRIKNIEETGLADEIIVEEYYGQKLIDIQSKNVDIFAIGSDWVDKFNYLKEYCKVIYLPRTKGVSSTKIRNKKNFIKIGIIGTGNIASRFVKESKFVSNVEISCVYSKTLHRAKLFGQKHEIQKSTNNLDTFIQNVDAVYIATIHELHYMFAKKMLNASKHVLCEKPLTLNIDQCKELWQLAEEKHLTFLEGVKTAFCEGFIKMVSFAKSGVIGDIMHLDCSFTKLIEDKSRREFMKNGGAHNELMSYMLLAAAKILGKNVKKYKNLRFYKNSQVDIFSSLNLEYANSIANLYCGIGAKKQGDLIISGTKGFIVCKAPWWKTKNIQIKFEDSSKDFELNFDFQGDGLRYEISEFANCISNKKTHSFKLNNKDSIFINSYINCNYSKIDV